MAIDGHFSLESELERFLARCPKLARIPQFDSLLKKREMMTEERVVNLLAEVFIHPKYTIPMMGCFRPICRKIVDKAVALLRLVPNLRYNSNGTLTEIEEEKLLGEAGNFEDAGDASVIEFYARNGWGLNLHELACLAFCRALDLAPFLLGSTLSYFRFAPPPFERILIKGSVSELPAKTSSWVNSDNHAGLPLAGKHLLSAVQAAYRFLLMEPDVFSRLWDWSCFLDLVQKLANLDMGDDDEFVKNISDIRWCGLQILSVILKMSDTTIANFGIGAEEALRCLLRWEELCEDVALEKAGWYFESSEQQKSDSINPNIDFDQENCLRSFGLNNLAVSSSQFPEAQPSTRIRRLATWDADSCGNPLVLTSSLKKSYEMVLLAVSQKWPVLLYGPAGAGKTALISKLARDSGNQVLSIHMDDQIDGKTLIGSYVCMERPGEFRWQPGSLTQAVMNGFWVVFESIDKAPSDVQSILLPLLEGASSFLTGHGEAIRVAESFRLFSTISSSNLDISCKREGGNSLGVLWRRVMIGHPSNEDLQSVVKAWYPELEPLAGKLIETFERVNCVPLYQLGGFQSGNHPSISSLSRFSLRDLLKWCKRIAALGFHFLGDGLSADACKCIFLEAVDIFAAFSASAENRLTIMRELAKMWAVSDSVAEAFYPPNKPVIQDLGTDLTIGRVTLQRHQRVLRHQKKPFVEIRSSLHLLERIACSVKCNEPVLLVGETGTGKTTLVQNLTMRLGQKLTVLNLSQQTDVADLLGGFKPMDAQFVCIPLYKEFENLFSKTFSVKDNGEFLARLQHHLSDKNWKMLMTGFKKGVDFFRKSAEIGKSGSGKKRKKALDETVLKAWEDFSVKLDTSCGQIGASSGMLFQFVEGAFVTALRNGDWILLDEVNLAPPETLQRVIGVLEDVNGSLCLAERGDASYIPRHPNFRLFACMNPATDAGKRDLPYSLRSRFTEYFVDDVLDDKDLTLFITQSLDDSCSSGDLVDKIVSFYKAAKKESEERLQDGANQKPQYSLRSLYRAIEYTNKAKRKFGFQKAIYDGFSMFFLTLLDVLSAKLMNQMILSKVLGGKIPRQVPFDEYLMVRGSTISGDFLENYILTKSVREHLRNLARAVLIKRYPVLLQGPTSSGKTSLVQYLAAITGHEFVRINNHEHTDLQEYLGSYVTDASGKLIFHEGVLVKAVRNGYWIVLDELNLAPSDVLEALNRLLDDNRELFVPELRETIPAHPDFMLFATQNPPTLYAGRKMLSRAFRNRFVEIHVDEIPEDELSTILDKRCKIPESYAKKMVEVMKELELHRQSSKVFAGKHGFITPRDLFRWADRFRTFGYSYEDLARDGYYLLAERLRDEGEKKVVQAVLEKHLRVKLVKDNLYHQKLGEGDTVFSSGKHAGASESLGDIIWTKSMQRLYFLVERCYRLREPVLLVGETGGGKTTICQLLSAVLGLKLHILNCHQYTETSDFLGGFYPIRERSRLISEFKFLIEQLIMLKAFVDFPGDISISSDIGHASQTLDQLDVIVNSYQQGVIPWVNVTTQDLDAFVRMKLDLAQLHQKWQAIFMWQDGPLVQAMKDGDLFLVDEISLADDSVLERLNSVLEPERKLALAEKGGSSLEKITAHPNFFLLATMNPGGDYGKKELSPALRNRFTEIWVPPVSDLDELRSIALQRFSNPEILRIVDPMLNFWEWFNQLQTGRALTVRDLLSWVAFINVTEKSLQPDYAFLHGAFLVLLDGLSLGTGISKDDAGKLRERCLSFLLEQLKLADLCLVVSELSRMENYSWGDLGTTADSSCSNNMQLDNRFGIHPFYIEKGDQSCEIKGFEFLAPTTCKNAFRVLRAMQLAKPVLLEGSPGVGKTSLIVALGKFSGHPVVRINLSEQTDIMDLLGSDLPVESSEGIKFAWSDGILLQALKQGSWVLLDELNLAPQSVLEGLNSILDHRAEVFIPELGVTFKCPSSFRVFACQNPSSQGGGRKGLPRSFLNRFTKVYVDELVEDDYLFICSSLYPSIQRPILSKLVLFNKQLHEDIMLNHKFAQDGFPWEFNLRDVIRSCEIIEGAPEKLKLDCFLNIVYVQRMRTAADRREVLRLYEQVFQVKPYINPYPRVQLNHRYLVVGNTSIRRNHFQSSKISSSQLKILPGIRQSLEAVAHCVQRQWLCILVGPSSSGKTSLIRLLAHLTGNVLNELSLSSATDISELLGCFEQYNAFRNFRSVVGQVECYVNEYCSLQLESSMEAFISERRDMITGWLAVLSSMDCGASSTSASTYMEHWKCNCSSLCLLVEIIEHLRVDLEKNKLPVSWSCEDLNRTQKTILKLQEDQQKRPVAAKFEWVTGLLIKALENGEWIVLENANLCNPTVLDRINSLVEPCGSITVNECGIVDGKPLVVHPHPNFRMFLTVNPSYGDVSRAMRNRGVEIFMMQPYWLLDQESDYYFEELELKDMKRFLVLSDIPGEKLVDAMAKAHIYARDEGLGLNVHITYLELARWVQLFQQLLMNGNQPLWSLQISWEHTYLSSLGEIEGGYIIAHARTSYLSAVEFSEFDSSLGCSLCLPGGWPRPLRIRDLVYHSREVGVKQNCMYLEFLGTQYASCELGVAWDRCLVGKALTASVFPRTDLMNVKILNHILFPKASNEMLVNYDRQTKFNAALIDKMLLFAANWTIEQATESDLKLYLLWFSWFSSRLLPFCQFFNSFLTQLKEELKHPIWNCIIGCYHELISHHQVNLDSQPIPMLSLELIDLIASDDMSKMSSRRLCNAINSIGLLRRSLQQWNTESGYNYTDESRCYIPVLRSLQVLEDEVLNALVESPSFDLLIQLLTNLVEDHILFWNSVTSSKFDYLLISWHSLMKDAMKLRDFFPKSVKHLLMEVRDLDRVSLWHLHSQKSLLWVYGGHPNLPSSADLYWKQHTLLSFCEFVWPTKTKSWEQVDDRLIDAVVSSSPDLRFLAMQGVCMSSYITGRCDKDDATVVQQLEEMHQMLLERFEHEKHKLEAKCGIEENTFLLENPVACCVFCPEVLCRKAGFDSWQETRSIIDSTSFFLDMELLQELSLVVLVDAKELQLALSSVSDLLEYAMNFSLNFSSRPPTIFLPHQKILWTLDAWESVNAVSAKIVSFVLEMWFRWHSSLWIDHPASVKNFSKIDAYDIPLPAMLVQPVKMAAIFQILESRFAIKDYHQHCLKLRVASDNLWKSSTPSTDLHSFLLSAARALFQQIIYTHQKTFDADNYATIKFILSSFQKTIVSQENIQVLSSLIASSSHHRLTTLIPSFIEPVLRELYLQCSSTEFLYNLGCSWSRIGGLRFCLLLSSSDLDPAMKYAIKYSLLEEKISSLELETKVRQECDHLVGWFSTREADKQRAKALENLRLERERLQKKMVFRSDPGKFKDLKHEFGEFLKRVTYLVDDLIKNIEVMDLEVMIGEVCNWQETATRFINRLSDEYAAYTDIIQPVQVAVYEMKLGLSLVLSSSLQKGFQNRVMQDNMDGILETIYSFIRFPRGNAGESIAVEVKFEFPLYGVGSPSNVWSLDMNVLEKLVTITRGLNADRTVSVLQLKAAVRQNILVRVAHFVANAHLFDNASFMLSNKIFDEIASFWMNMKVQVKGKEDYDAQQYKFKPRAFKIENVIEIDISTLGNSFANESFSEWQELLSEDEFTEKKDANEELEEEWSLMQESSLSNMVHIHNQLFGSVNLVLNPGVIQVSDADRLRSFIDSYTLGVGMIKGLEGLLSSSLDVKLVPEHLLRLCLEHEPKFVSYHKIAHTYNFYKDPNAPMMAKMVKLLTALQKRVLSLLNEWEDHPGLQKLLDVIEMLLAIPSSTPLAKALSGLQFLLNRIRILQENGSKFSLPDQLEPIILLASSWKKIEFDSWPALLDEVQDQYEINGGKLWFPLYSVLQHRQSDDIATYNQLTIQSLEEFIQTSSIGEFRKRLELLFAFHGQISTGISLGIYSSPFQMENLKILYNVFGYYVQFLLIALEHIEANRKNIEMELKELLKLCRWERSESYLSMENSKKTRQKLRKLIKKYTDLLQQPVMLILNLEATRRGIKSKSIQELKVLGDFPDKHGDELNAAIDLTEFSDKNRSVWYPDWRKKVAFALQTLQLGKTPEFNITFLCFEDAQDVENTAQQDLASPSPCLVYLEDWREVCSTLEHVCRTVTECADLWKDVSKSLGKRRALSELLKLLESCGLSRHKSIFFEDQLKSNQSSWLLQPSYDVQHLLPTQGRLPYQNVGLAASSQLQSSIHEVSGVEWGTANRYYYKSIASVHLLRQICLNFHKDFTLEQVNRSVSFLDHLIIIQQEQRNAVYHFSEHVKDLRESVASLENLHSSSNACDNGTDSKCSVAPNQHATLKYMWQQKQLFDSLCSMLHEESLLLRTVESTHLSTCQHVKGSANRVLVFIEKFVAVFKKSKESLDDYLLGRNRVLTTVATSFYPPVITKQMEQLVFQNFQVIREFEECLCAFQRQEVDRRSVQEVLLNRFEDIMKKGKAMAEQFNNALEGRSELSPCDENYSELEAGFYGAFERTLKHIRDAFQKLGPLNNSCAVSEWSSDNITSWKVLFESYVMNLRLDSICDQLHKTIFFAGKLLNHSGNKIPSLCFQVETYFKHLYQLLDLVLGFSDGLLHDFLDVHKKVSMMTHVLANVFASLYSEGFGTPAEDQVDDNSHDTSQDAKGTGMGEGAGLKDVSDQISDEDQLLGASEKPSEEQDMSNEVPSKNDKGIEMEQDFAADTFSVSEESGDDDNEDSGDEQLDSAMGETGADSEVVDEKLWNKDEDENANNTKEKYESGPSVTDKDGSSRELRAKEDDAAAAADEPGELNQGESNEQNDEIGSQDDLGNTENMEDMNMDKEEAFADPSGLKLDETNPMEEDLDMDEQEGADPMEEAHPEEHDKFAENGDGKEEDSNPADENHEEAGSGQLDGNSERDDLGKSNEENADMDLEAPREDVLRPGNSDFISDHVPNAESATQPKDDMQAADSRNMAPETKWSNSGDIHNNLAPISGLPSNNTSEMEMMVADSSMDGKLTNDQPKTQLPQQDSSSIQKTQANPYRNVGDALEEWKERVRVSSDLQEDNVEAPDNVEDENADEYGYVSEFEKGTAQALGPATFDQIDKNITQNEPDIDGVMAQKEDLAKKENEKQNSETEPIKSSTLNLKKRIEEQMQISDSEVSPKETSAELHGQDDGNPESMSESLVSIKRSYLDEDIYQLSKLSVSNELGKTKNLEEASSGTKDNAAVLWRRYELLTTRLSQELAEQLRLVMEPTLASKLQGDYKTGKRINMKKVIPYIASHYRKDKIWLRRTRPNKRDYQVVIAVDDSRSMSESCCGDVAIEALVTVCRAMSQLEVGNLAVASYGKEGNIRLLHDFDQSFTGEAGIKMISNLTFKQENTIKDEPVVDLLKYLNNMLDAAVANARLPSGQNPLQQLVLIIADGRFIEKENLKRCVRDVLSRKRMVAFLLLDSPQESIMDLQEVSFHGGNMKISKYLDSFPFPYYIILKNIEALPRTLADLLRQWFELMQHSRD